MKVHKKKKDLFFLFLFIFLNLNFGNLNWEGLTSKIEDKLRWDEVEWEWSLFFFSPRWEPFPKDTE